MKKCAIYHDLSPSFFLWKSKRTRNGAWKWKKKNYKDTLKQKHKIIGFKMQTDWTVFQIQMSLKVSVVIYETMRNDWNAECLYVFLLLELFFFNYNILFKYSCSRLNQDWMFWPQNVSHHQVFTSFFLFSLVFPFWSYLKCTTWNMSRTSCLTNQWNMLEEQL